MTYKRIAGAVAALALGAGGVLAPANPAQAQDGHYPDAGWLLQDTTIGPEVDWSDCDPAPTRSDAVASAITGPTSVELVGKGDPAPPHYGTSIETVDLGLATTVGTVVAVDYELHDASPAAGAVRLFVYDHADGDTDCEAPAAFVAAPDDGGTSGTLAIRVTWEGALGTVGMVYDSSNGDADGKVVFSNLRVDDMTVLFTEPEYPTPDPTVEPTPTAGPSESPAPGGVAEGQLPNTGSGWLLPLLAVGGAFAAAGVVIYRLTRRRPVRFTTE